MNGWRYSKKLGARRVPSWRMLAVILVALGIVLSLPAAALADEQVAFAGHTSCPTGDHIQVDGPDYELTLVKAQPEATVLATPPELDTSDKALKALVLTALERRDKDEVDVSIFNKSCQEFNNLYHELLLDHPELFDVEWTLHGTYDDSHIIQTFIPSYYLGNYTDDRVLRSVRECARFRSSMALPFAVLLAKLIAIRTYWNCSSEQLPLRW